MIITKIKHLNEIVQQTKMNRQKYHNLFLELECLLKIEQLVKQKYVNLQLLLLVILQTQLHKMLIKKNNNKFHRGAIQRIKTFFLS